MSASKRISLGLDIGTSGVRGICINDNQEIIASVKKTIQDKSREALRNPLNWRKMLVQVLTGINDKIPLETIDAISVDGQSGTVLLSDEYGKLFDNTSLLYNDAPNEKTKHKLITLIGSSPPSLGRAYELWIQADQPQHFYIVHQADWIAGLLCGNFNNSDENNSLKMGYSPEKKDWVFDPKKLPFSPQALPKVTTPSILKGFATTQFSRKLGLSNKCKVYSGTTDSTAGFIAASGLQRLSPGIAVTSLGTTLAIKLVSSQAIEHAKFGVYSHKLFDVWVAGGASNSGAGILLQYFDIEEIKQLSKKIDPRIPSPLDYYPLLIKGERFPINDLEMISRVAPRPESDVDFLAGLFESIARIEKQAYDVLDQLGAPYPNVIKTVGGGSYNQVWTSIRERVLGVEIIRAEQPDAAYGSALIAQLGCRKASN